MLVKYILSSVCLTSNQFSQLYFMQYMELCVFSLTIYLMVIMRIRVLYLIVIINSEVWPICHCLGLGHETMVCAACPAILGRCYVPGYRPRNGLLIVVYTGVRPRSGLFTTVYPGVRPRSGLLDVTYPGVRPRSGLLDVVQPGVRTRTRRGLFRVYRGVPGHPVPFTVEPSTMLWN